MSKPIVIRTERFRVALGRWAATSRKGLQGAVAHQLRLFVKDVVRITPPNRGKLNKTGGERTVRKQLSGIMRESRRAGAEEPRTIHQRYRKPQGGVRTNLKKAGGDTRHRVRNLRSYITTVIARVGKAAAGWGAAAQALGLPLPGWVARHGSTGGSYRDTATLNGRRIRMTNSVSFPNQEKLENRIRGVADRRAALMERQIANFARIQARRAGFRT